MKVAVACSAGGHLTEVLQLEGVFRQREHFFVTFRREDSKELAKRERVYFIIDPKRNPLKLMKNLFQSVWVLLKERPSVILTTGAGVVIPFCYLAKLARAKIIYIESFCRVREPSFTGKLLYPIADLFFVQWEDMLEKYGKKAAYEGGVF